MQTALHIATLVAQLKDEIVGGRLVTTEFYKKQRAAYFFVKKQGSKVALGFVFHPAGSGSFCVPASKISLDTREKPWPIFGLDGAEIVAIEQLGLDRLFRLTVDLSGVVKQVVFEATGPNGNLWLLDEQGGRQATLRNRKFTPGEAYQPVAPVERISPFEITPVQIADRLAADKSRSPLAILKGMMQGFNETMIRETLRRAGISLAKLSESEPTDFEQLARSIQEMAGWFGEDRSGYLYEIRGAVEVFPFKLVSRDYQPEKSKTLSLAVMEMVSRRHSAGSDADLEKVALKAVSRVVKKKTRLISNLKADIEQASDYPRYKLYGELLQLNRDRLKKGMTSIEVDDLLSGVGGSATIKLDAAVSPNQNIENYFRRHRKGREGIDLLERRLEIASEELKALTAMQDDLETDFESASQRYEAELVSLGPRLSDKAQQQPRLPYRPSTLSTGLTIFIGRDGADNDRTTFEFARPYEFWFHTSQCPGSHVVMKFPNKSFEPSKREIEETAAIAAFHSKARNDSLVPVIYTQRRYVRKPRKAKPGLVTVERERSVMVAPQKEIGGQ
jgi:predicted ribosome quality control (RQC) complex YloA/Tae2 family protein